jgi:hypothetical protein
VPYLEVVTVAVEVEVVAVTIMAVVGPVLEDLWVAVLAQLPTLLLEVVAVVFDLPLGASKVLLQALGVQPGSCSKISLLRLMDQL